MGEVSETTQKKISLIKEQLISLMVLHKMPKSNEDLAKILREEKFLKNINSQILSSICYFLLGIIDVQERDKLIKWPLINIQTHTKFRKGLSSMILHFQEKFPWAQIKKLPESYFVNPYGQKSKVVDFLLRLTNLAIHMSLNDPELLYMHSGEGVNAKEIDIIRKIICEATEREEEFMSKNIFPVELFEAAKDSICDKCIALRQENDSLEQKLSDLMKVVVKEGYIKSEKSDIEALQKLRDEKISEVKALNEELAKYHESSKELLSKLKALKNPVSLSSTDFGCEKFSTDISRATSKVCEELCLLFQNLMGKRKTKEEEESIHQQLLITRKALNEEKEVLESFILKMS